MLEFDHADVAFGEVVVERDAVVVREAQHVFAVAVEAPEEIVGGGLADHAAFAGRDGAGGVGVTAERDDLLIGGAVVGELAGIEPVLPGRFGARDSDPQAPEQPVDPDCSGVLGVGGVGFDHGDELAEVMHVAQRVLHVGVVAVGPPPVVDRDPSEMTEHAGVIKASKPALVMD